MTYGPGTRIKTLDGVQASKGKKSKPLPSGSYGVIVEASPQEEFEYTVEFPKGFRAKLAAYQVRRVEPTKCVICKEEFDSTTKIKVCDKCANTLDKCYVCGVVLGKPGYGYMESKAGEILVKEGREEEIKPLCGSCRRKLTERGEIKVSQFSTLYADGRLRRYKGVGSG